MAEKRPILGEAVLVVWAKWQGKLQISGNIVREIGDYFGQICVLPICVGSNVRFVDVTSGQTLPTGIRIPYKLTFCLVSNLTVMAFSAIKSSKSVFTISIPAKTISKCSNMQQARIHPAVLSSNGSLYVFGGQSPGKTQTCEVYNRCKWSDLPSLRYHRVVSFLSILDLRIYVLTKFPHSLIEVFNVEKRQFGTIFVPYIMYESWVFPIIVEKALVLISRKEVPGGMKSARNGWLIGQIAAIQGEKAYTISTDMEMVYDIDLRTYEISSKNRLI